MNLLRKYARAGIRTILGGIFLYAGSISIRTPEEFADSIAGYQLLPMPTINLLALTLPPLEILVGILLIAGLFRRVTTFSALLLTLVFIVALASAIARGLTIDCGCFGHEAPSRLRMWLALGRDVVFAMLLIRLYRGESRTPAASQATIA